MFQRLSCELASQPVVRQVGLGIYSRDDSVRRHDLDNATPATQSITVDARQKRLCKNFEQLVGLKVGLVEHLASAVQVLSTRTRDNKVICENLSVQASAQHAGYPQTDINQLAAREVIRDENQTNPSTSTRNTKIAGEAQCNDRLTNRSTDQVHGAKVRSVVRTFQPSDDWFRVVRPEALLVQHCGDQVAECLHTHIAVLPQLVPLEAPFHDPPQGDNVCRQSREAEADLVEKQSEQRRAK